MALIMHIKASFQLLSCYSEIFSNLLIISWLRGNHCEGLLLSDEWGGQENIVINDSVEYLKHTNIDFVLSISGIAL